MRDYRQLPVWNSAHNLCLEVYRHSGGLPTDKQFGLTSQIRRCAVSIGSNIAEDSGRRARVDFARFIDIALDSLIELEYQLFLVMELKYLTPSAHRALKSQTDKLHKFGTQLQVNI